MSEKMTNWRGIPFLRYGINQPSEGDISSGYNKIIFSINLALEKTFEGRRYKKFAILFTTKNEKEESVFEIFCHEIEFMTNLEKFIDGRYTKTAVEPILKRMLSKFSKVIAGLPIGRFMAATIVYDEQAGKISLGEEPLQRDITTTSGLLFHLSQMFHTDIIADLDGLIIELYNLRKLMFYNIDTNKIDLSRIRINANNFEEWDYYYPEYDREVEENKKKYQEIFEEKIKEDTFKKKSIEIPQDDNEFKKIIHDIIIDFKNMVENEGYKLLIDDDGKPRDESICQVLFDVYLKKYCRTLDIDLTKEPETGRGPIDFRFSLGVDFIAHVEVKKDTNPKLEHGLEKQLPTYMKSDEVNIGFFVIFDFGQKQIDSILKRMEHERKNLQEAKKILVDIICIDARKKISASKIK